MRASPSSAGIGKRESSRLKLNIRGRLTSARGTQLVELVDLSQTGARLELSATLGLTEALVEWLDFEARGFVIWQDRRLCGLRFEEPIPSAWVTATRSASQPTVR